MDDLIALVNQDDVVTAFADKLDVHANGLLHRAFSVFIFNSQREMLIHRRASDKYHSPGLWTNACCSHLPQNFSMEDAVNNRLDYEMGISCNLAHLFTFHYTVNFDHGLIENEIDHVYCGFFDGIPRPNPTEVSEWKWENPENLYHQIKSSPGDYTYWFRYIMDNFSNKIKSYCIK